MAIETAFSVRTGIVMIQEPLFGNRDIRFSGFDPY